MIDRMQNTPLDEWPAPWLRMECASILKWSGYLLATESEKRAEGAPVTDDEMRTYIRAAEPR